MDEKTYYYDIVEESGIGKFILKKTVLA